MIKRWLGIPDDMTAIASGLIFKNVTLGGIMA
jgi:hypothetical protein